MPECITRALFQHETFAPPPQPALPNETGHAWDGPLFMERRLRAVVRSSRSGIQSTEQRRQCRKQTCNSNMYHLVLRTPPSPLPGARVQKWMDGEKIIIAFAVVPLAVYFIKSSFCKQTSLSGHWTNQTHLCTIALPPRWFRVK